MLFRKPRNHSSVADLASVTTIYLHDASELLASGFASKEENKEAHNDNSVVLILYAVSVCITIDAYYKRAIRHGELYILS